MLYNFLSHIHQTLRLFNPVVSVLCKILDTLRLTIIMARPFEFSSKVTGVIHSVFESFLERNTAQTLDESRHAPPSEDQDIVTSTYSPSTVCFLSLSLSFSSLTTHPPICPFPSSPPFLPPATTASILNVTLLFSVSIIVLSCLFSFYWELMCGSITQKQSSAAGYRTPPVFHTQSPSPSLSSSYHSNISDSHTSSGEKPPAKMYPIADVDDTAGFMAAARALKLDPNAYRKVSSVVAASEDASSEHGSLSKSHDDAKNPTSTDDSVLTSTPKEPSTPAEFQVKGDADFAGPGNDSTLTNFVAEPMPLEVVEQSSTAEFVSADTLVTTSHASVGEEDREHQATFETWGTPEIRDKPGMTLVFILHYRPLLIGSFLAAARVRRVIIRGLPSTWKTPAMVLSLIHGGTIESISVGPSGTAQVLFCDPEACKAFYDKYPNGIDLDKERKVTVFVEMGKEVDVVSSQLSFSLSTGATRAVRAVGVDLDVTMRQLFDLAAGNHRKVEKILDNYVPGEARNVIFRFCSIDDAVRFRAVLVRNESWEQCNIQYAADPCELATGYHTN
ncbi:hypothetical protein BDV35DRAFT_379997 [Aspergillus flavus]|uniref:DNA, SC001 n=2 Tax=Aspergillus subgen. Circumdati TaxID=2720871 RepID=Q2UMN8_ASPOR|nr:unnamed protein product [Aspergillus oryzae RIB40]KAB8247271.1 hypothetical protein BDV35DRAFT_379997 [Aspergillus flavus]BAE57177.1 unnamed protein product [Aspergillus oryzae RIB40]